MHWICTGVSRVMLIQACEMWRMILFREILQHEPFMLSMKRCFVITKHASFEPRLLPVRSNVAFFTLCSAEITCKAFVGLRRGNDKWCILYITHGAAVDDNIIIVLLYTERCVYSNLWLCHWEIIFDDEPAECNSLRPNIRNVARHVDVWC